MSHRGKRSSVPWWKRALGRVEGKLLAVLLRRVAKNNYYFPTEESFRAYHGLRSQCAPELVISRIADGRAEVLLARYDGGIEEFLGLWHIPGGYDVPEAVDIQETCSSIARRELGVDVTYVRTFDQPYKWKRGEHPYGIPLSLYVECVPRGAIIETESRKFFPLSDLPKSMVEPHRRFISEQLAYGGEHCAL